MESVSSNYLPLQEISLVYMASQNIHAIEVDNVYYSHWFASSNALFQLLSAVLAEIPPISPSFPGVCETMALVEAGPLSRLGQQVREKM